MGRREGTLEDVVKTWQGRRVFSNRSHRLQGQLARTLTE